MLCPIKRHIDQQYKGVHMQVYIGSAIDTSFGSPEEQFKELSDLVINTLGDSVVLYNPLTAFGNAHRAVDVADLEFVVAINTAAINRCQAGVFIWTDSPSYGVPVEIENFSQSMKPFVVWNRASKSPGLYLRYATKRFGLGRITSSREETVEAVRTLVGLVGATQFAEKGQE